MCRFKLQPICLIGSYCLCFCVYFCLSLSLCVCHDILIIVSSKKVKPMVCVWVQIAPNLFNWKSSNCRIRTSSVIGEILSPRYPNGVSDHHHRWYYHIMHTISTILGDQIKFEFCPNRGWGVH